MSGLPVRDRAGERVGVEQYERMIAAGVFAPGERLELIDGEIVEMSPIGDPHQVCVVRLTDLFARLASDQRALLLVQGACQIGDWSVPEPDLALLRRRGDFYGEGKPQPSDLLLIVEVADSSLRYDRDVKRPLYGRSGVVEMWLVDVNGRAVEVATRPSRHGYGHIVRALPGDTIAPAAFPDLTVDVGWLLGRLPRR